MNISQYFVSADSGRWWWAPAAAGATAAAMAVAIPVSAGYAMPVDDAPVATTTARTGAAVTIDEGGTHPCFMGRPAWVDAGNGPQPTCPTGPDEPAVQARAAVCPPPPDPRYVGVPWVPAEPTGCPSMDRWWTMITVSDARR